MKNEEFSDEKLRDLLKESKSDQAFRVPDQYFENLNGKIMSGINSLPDFEKQAASQPFSTPQSYFDILPQTINNKILADDRTEFSIIRWLFNSSRLIPATFSILLLIGSYFYFTRTQTFRINKEMLTEDETDASQYLQSVNENDLIEYLADQSEEQTTDEYDQYFIEHDFDISQLEKNL